MLRPAFALVVVSLSVSVTGVRTDSPDPARSVPFEMARGGAVAVPVTVNGAGPFLFLLDTGSSHSAVSDGVARSAGAPAVARTVIASPIGDETRTVVRMDRLAVGPTTARDVLASVVRQASLDPGGRIRGLLGQDVLAAHRYTLDFVDRRVHWDDTTRPDRAWTTKMCFEAGRFLVDVPVGSSVLRLVPDSGSEGLVLFERQNRPISSSFAELESAQLSTLGGRTRVRRVWIDELRLGPFRVRGISAAIVGRPASTAAEGDGLLPLHLFGRVTLDGPAQRLTASAPLLRTFRP